MNCDCLEAITKEKDKFKKDREVKWAHLVEQMDLVHFETYTTRIITYSTIEVVEEGRKRPRKAKLGHNYCPFCGIRQDEMHDTSIQKIEDEQ